MNITQSNTRYMEIKINHRGYMIMGTTDNTKLVNPDMSLCASVDGKPVT